MLPVLLVALSAFYFMKKEWLKPAMMWAFTLGFLLLYNISDPHAPYRFYSEVTYLPLSIFVAIPFLFDGARHWLPGRYGQYVCLLLTGLMVLRLTTIALNHRTFDRLYAWVGEQVAQPALPSTNRFIMKLENAPMDTVLMEWGVPFTAMHLTALHGPEKAKTLLILTDFEKYREQLESDGYFLSPFKAIEIEKQNSRYYRLGRGRYVEIGGE